MKKQKIVSIMTIIIFLGILFGFAIAFVIKPSVSYSAEEKRNLQTFPEFTWQKLKDGEFTEGMNAYLNDQFPLRGWFVNFECGIEQLLLKKENNGGVFGKNDQMAVRLFSAHDGLNHEEGYVYPYVDFFYKEHVSAQLGIVKSYFKKFDEMQIPFTAILAPRTIDAAASAFDYPSENSDKLISFVREKLKGENYIDLYDNYRALYAKGEYVYFKTDHHWTTLGAYYAYAEVMKAFGMDYYDIDDFDVITASDEFYGTTYAKAGNREISPDTIDYWVLKGDDPGNYTMKIKVEAEKNNGEEWKTFSGFYDFDYLDKLFEGSDKYSMFLSSTNGLTFITRNNAENRQTLLLVKDSFGHSLAPFLALHFDLVVVDISMVPNLVNDYAFEADKVLLCYNLENIIKLKSLSKAANLYKLVDGGNE